MGSPYSECSTVSLAVSRNTISLGMVGMQWGAHYTVAINIII